MKPIPAGQSSAQERGPANSTAAEAAYSISAVARPATNPGAARPRRPTSAETRNHALDALRGFALLGPIVAHIAIFAHPVDLSLTWTTLPYEGLTRLYFQIAYVFVYGKAGFLFGMLFGASVVFFASKDRREGGGEAGRLWYRRMRWLAVFGILHGFLLFHADVPLLYAVSGMIVLWRVRFRSARWLTVAGTISYLSGTFLSLGLMLLSAGAGDVFVPVERQLAAFGGSFWSAASLRATMVIGIIATLPLFFWTAAGVMMLGMALMKARVLTGNRSDAFYLRLCLIGLGAGMPITASVYGWAEASPADPLRITIWMGTHQMVGKVREQIPREHLAPMWAITYPSSDGLEIPAFLTLPTGVPAKGLPLLVLPHGGP